MTRDALELARGESIEQLTADLLDVADGKFFRLVTEGPKTRHAFVPDKLWYALGLRFAYEVHEASNSARASEDTRDIVARILEPILEMDVATDILLAAFAVSVLHPQLSTSVACWLLVELAELRNRRDIHGSPQGGENVQTYIMEAPEVYVQAADALLDTPVLWDDWIVDALRRGLQLEGRAKRLVERAIRKWLSHSPAAQSTTSADEPTEFSPVREAWDSSSFNLATLGSSPSVVLALRILAGQPCESFLSELRALIDSGEDAEAELAIWLWALDEATAWTGDFVVKRGVPHAAPPNESAEDSHTLLRRILAQWRMDRDGGLAPEFDASVYQMIDNLADRPWNLVLAPSLPGVFSATMTRNVQCTWRPDNDHREQMTNVEYLLESLLISLPVDERVEILTRVAIDINAAQRHRGLLAVSRRERARSIPA